MLSRAAKRIPGLQSGWRLVWGGYCATRSVVRAVRGGVSVASDTELARAYSRGADTKAPLKRAVENAAWAVRRGGPNPFYYAYGLDSGGKPADYMSVTEMMQLIDRQVEEDGTEHAVSVLKNKYFFSLIAESLGHRSPRVLALLRPDGVVHLNPRRSVSYETFIAEAEPIDAFAKLAGGEKGRGAFALRVEGGNAWIDGTPAEASSVAELVTARYLLQERIVQHEALAALHASSVNTIRLVTVYRGGTVEPLAAALRVGTGGSPVDNWSAGGLVVSLDLSTGRLSGRGIFKPRCGGEARYGGFVDRHPDSGLLLDGYALPMIPEAVELARAFHRDLGGPRTVGWDLSITPDGPIVVEGNSHWSGAMYMALDSSFKGRYLHAVS